MIALIVAILISFTLAYNAAPDPSQALLYGIFGTSLTAMAMLSLAGIVLSIDAFGPIADNAGGIVEMTGMGEENHTSYAPYTCTQCAEAWCMVACPVEAITVSPVGAKVVLEDVCVGCKLCTIACPYGTMFYNPETHKATKCNLCSGTPACVEACPTDAIEYVEAEPRDWLAAFAAERSGAQLAKLSTSG